MATSTPVWPAPAGPVLQPPSPDPAPPTARRWLGWRSALAAAAVAAALVIDRSTIFVVALVFVVVVPFEKWFPRHRQQLRRPQVGTDIAFAVTSTIVSTAGLFVAVVVAALSLAWLPGLALRPVVGLLPGLVQMLLGVVLFDVVVYWAHRFAHEVPAGWRFHKVHHSTVHLDWVSGFRNHPFDGVLLAPAFVFLLAAGFSAELTGALVVIQIVTGLFLHANVRWRWKPLHKVLITPEFHHWHHSNERDAHCSNYSVLLPVWDIIFGTYFMPSDRRPQHYGIDDPVPDGMVAQLWKPVSDLPNPLWVVRHPLRSVRRAARWVRLVIRQMRHSATHPRHRRIPVS